MVASTERRRSAWTVRAILLVYIAGFCAFWPGDPTVIDEASYVRAAEAFAHGSTMVPMRDGLTQVEQLRRPSDYPPGTSLLQAPIVRLFGRHAAPLLSLVCFCLTALLLAHWLESSDRSPLFVLAFVGYLPALVLGRVAMSDLPSALVVCAAQWLLFHPRGSTADTQVRGFIAGFLAGCSLVFRETNALFVGPLIVGSIIRREGRISALLLGGMCGCAIRLLVSAAIFGNPFFVKDHGYGWSVANVPNHLWLYALALLIFVPLGLVWAVRYRGERRPELVATVLIAVGFFLLYGYDGSESGFLKRLVLGPRYFIPLVPLLSIAMAESMPRLLASLSAAAPRLVSAGQVTWICTVGCAVLAVHPVLWRFSREQNGLANSLCSASSPGGALILDRTELDKWAFFCGDRGLVDFSQLEPAKLPILVARDGIAHIALMERSDSEFHRSRGVRDAQWIAAAAKTCALHQELDDVRGTMHLTMFRVDQCPGASPALP